MYTCSERGDNYLVLVQFKIPDLMEGMQRQKWKWARRVAHMSSNWATDRTQWKLKFKGNDQNQVV